MRLFDEVQARTTALGRSVQELSALSEVSQAINSTLDLHTVLDTIVAKAAQLSGTEAGAIYVRDERQEFQLRATYGMSEELIAAIRDMHAEISDAVGELTEAHEPNQVADLRELPPTPVNDTILRAGYRARLLVPLVEAGKLELNPQTVELAPLIDEVIGTARQLAEQNKNRLVVDVQENLGALTVDPMRLRQILLNLLSNACKFTKEGEVKLRGAQGKQRPRLGSSCPSPTPVSA